jgi:hypothetical protein
MKYLLDSIQNKNISLSSTLKNMISKLIIDKKVLFEI